MKDLSDVSVDGVEYTQQNFRRECGDTESGQVHGLPETQTLGDLTGHQSSGFDPKAESHFASEAHEKAALGTIVELWRQRQDLKRARQRLDLQCQAIIRRALDGDKEAAGKLWGRIQKGDDAGHEMLATILMPYRMAMEQIDAAVKAIEGELKKLVRKMPIWLNWAKDVKGIAEVSLAGMLGEAAYPVESYKSVSALWKRFGLAVIGGERQRRVSDAAAALVHGYSPQRRSYAYVVGTNLMRSQGDDDPYRKVYVERREYELARGLPKAHAHNRAQRYMTKRLLRDWYAAAKRNAA